MEFLKRDYYMSNENQGVSTGSKWIKAQGSKIYSYSPVDGKLIGSVIGGIKEGTTHDEQSAYSFSQWRNWTAPKTRRSGSPELERH